MPRPVALEDILRFKIAGDTQISPDGLKVVFTVRTPNPEKNKYFTSLWMADTQTGDSRPFTGDGHSDGNPVWSPDGTQVAFVSDREKPKSQIYVIDAAGGEAQPLTRLEEGGISEITWSPDGTQIAFLYRETPAQYRKEALKEREEKELSSPVRVHKKLFYRLDGVGYFNDSFSQIHILDVAAGKVRKLTDEAHHLGSLAWSPDGSQIGFIANRSEDDDRIQNHDNIWTIPAAGGEIRQILAPDGPKFSLAWSPDGRSLAYIGHNDPDDSWGGRNERVLVIPAAGGTEARDLTGDSDLSVNYLTLADTHDSGGGRWLYWSPDGRTLFFPISTFGDTRLYSVSADGGKLTALTPEKAEMGAFSMSRDGARFGIVLGTGTDTGDAYLGELSGAGFELRRLSRINQDLMAEVNLQMPDALQIPNGDGGTVHTWLLRPTSFDSSRKCPCILYVHGGPAAQYGGESAVFHELQWLASEGYAVIFSNPRGSKGYGEAHTSAIKGDWGNRDWVDVQAVADYAASLPYVDSSRMAIMGGSYGGYMTAWAVGHTDRFACAITDRLVGNVHSMSGTCDFPWEHGKFYKGNAWDDPSDMWRVSPLAFAGRINTPLLIVHSDGDLRCPVGQAEELFAALRLQGKQVEFVRYPAESSHGLSRNGPPDLRIDRLRRNLAWLDKHLKPGTS